MDDIDVDLLNEAIVNMGNGIKEVCKQLYDIVDKLVDSLKKLEKIENKLKYKPKYKPVLNLIKPYKPPIIKIRAKARSNI